MQNFDPSKGPGGGNGSYLASQRTGGSEGASGGGMMSYQPGSGMPSMPMISPYDQYSNNRPMGMGMAGGYGNQNSAGNFDGPMRNRDVGNAGGYEASEPASDTNEREQRDFIAPLPPNSPMGSLGGTTYNDPRNSTYTEGVAAGFPPKSSRRTESDVKEIAKEVAELLLPQLRANDASRTTPPVSSPRQLPLQPSDSLSTGSVHPPDQPRSPGPPQYERYNM